MSARTIEHYNRHIAKSLVINPLNLDERVARVLGGKTQVQRDVLAQLASAEGKGVVGKRDSLRRITHWTSADGSSQPIAAMSTWHLLCTVAMLWRCTAARSRSIDPRGVNGERVIGPQVEPEEAKRIIRAMLREVRRRDLADAAQDDL